MQVLFLFGAGASKYAGGVAPASPPDGKGLFEALTQHDSFFRDKVDPNIAQAFRENFEKGMEELVAKQGEYVTMFLIKMSQYFYSSILLTVQKIYTSDYLNCCGTKIS